jgi:hypothetical protein
MLTPEQKELVQKWIDALRSGNYQQGCYMLRSLNDKFCCLGVLCDIVDPTRWTTDLPVFPDRYHFAGNIGTLPDDVINSVGISMLFEGDLMTLNDNQGNSFTEIADYLETRLLNT